MRIFITTFGTRGDIQPYVALGRELQRAGHHVDVAMPEGFRDLVTGTGIGFHAAGSDLLGVVQQAMPTMRGVRDVSHILRSMHEAMRRHIDEQWEAAQAAQPDLVVYHPKCLVGPSVAQRFGVRSVLSLPLPFYTPTRDFPVPFIGAWPLGGWANRASYGFTRISNLMYAGMINAFRRRIGLGRVGRFDDPLRTPDGAPVPVLYPFSRHVVPVPADYPPSAHVTGYWFLPRDAAWRPDPQLSDFLQAGRPPVYVGFGSMGFGKDAGERAEAVLSALQANRVRGILATGWGGLAAGDTPSDDVLVVDSVPHDWLFPQVAAVVHHGGAGTTAAGLAAGRPTLIRPFLGDQQFWGQRVQRIGVGPPPLTRKQFTAQLSERIDDLLGNKGYRHRAAKLGAALREEDGAGNAVRILETLGR